MLPKGGGLKTVCLEAQDSNLQQDRGGDLQLVCRKRQFDQTTFSAPELAVQLCRSAMLGRHFSSTRGIDVKDRSSSTYTSGIATIYSSSSDRGELNCLTIHGELHVFNTVDSEAFSRP